MHSTQAASSARKRTTTASSAETQKSVDAPTIATDSSAANPSKPAGAAHSGPATIASPLSLPRALLRGLAMRASQNPIEVVVSIFIVVTLSYFQLVHVLATSNFFEPLSREASGLAAAASTGRETAFFDSIVTAHGAGAVANGNVFVRKAGQSDWTAVTSADQATGQDDTPRYVIEPFVLADAQSEPAATLESIAQKLSSHIVEPSGDVQAVVEPFSIREAASGLVGYGFGRISKFDAQHWATRQATLQKIDDEDFLGSVINDSVTAAAAITAPKKQPYQSRVRFAGRPSASPLQEMQLSAIFPDSDLRDFFTTSDSDQVRSMRWLGYALWALVVRFGALLKRADSADIFVMLSAYILMHGTFVNLFISMRRFGSNFWLGASVLTSSICSFLVALTMAHLLGVTVDPICLSEALPFLVITVGFEKPFLLTKAVFTQAAIAPQPPSPTQASKKDAHPSLLLSALNDSQQAVERQRQQQTHDDARRSSVGERGRDHLSQEESFVRALTARLKSEPSLRWTSPQPVPAKEVVVAAVDEVGVQIVRDYAIEIAVMAVGATSGISGLREFCQLAAIILLFDCAFLFAFYVGVLTIMVEVHRIKVLRGRKRVQPTTPPNVDSDVPLSLNSPSYDTEPVSPTDTRAGTSPSLRNANLNEHRPSSKDAQHRAPRPLWRKIVILLLGKVPFERPSRPGARENPVARLKLLLVTTFITLHSLNLVSTLTTQSAITRHHSTDGPTLYQQVQDSSRALLMNDAQSPLLSPLLAQLSVLQTDSQSDLFVKVHDPIAFVLSHAPSTHTSTRSIMGEVALNASNGGQSNTETPTSLAVRLGGTHAGITRSSSNRQRSPASSFDVLDSFMSGWTIIVGDPVISKWISVGLVISIFLNAFLLKGIATGNTAVADGNAAGAAAFVAARMIGAHLNRPEDEALSLRSATNGKEGAPAPSASADRLSEYHRSLAKAASAYANRQPQSIKTSDEVAVDGKEKGASIEESEITPQRATLSINGVSSDNTKDPRSLDEIVQVYADGAGVVLLSDEEVILLVQKGKIAGYALEKILQDHERAVRVRRATISRASTTKTLEQSLVPLAGYDYAQVMGACCENVVGFMPLPLGIAGPLMVDGQMLPIPMATTEGTLVASTSRGCKALNSAGGVTTVLTQDAMTRGPAVEFSSITQAAKAKRWIDSADGASTIKEAFDSTSRFARLSSLRCVMAGRTLYIRFATSTGDAMGMNMVSKGVEKALACMGERFDMTVLSLSGNYCIDKKPSAINWIEGRGKSVCCEAVIPGQIVKSVLKTSVESLVNLNLKKNLIGSAMAGSIGGFNAHAANIVAAVFLATGQDPAQVVESSMCMTLMEAIPSRTAGVSEPDLLVTVSMPSIEVGTVGGGTILSPQRALLDMLGVAGSSKDIPGANAQRLARIIAAAVMAGELSLMGALSAGHLIQAHMKHNRSVPPTPGNVTPTSSQSLASGLSSMSSVVSSPSAASSARSDGSLARFQSSMTPLVAPSIAPSNAQSRRGSPVGTMKPSERRSVSEM